MNKLFLGDVSVVKFSCSFLGSVYLGCNAETTLLWWRVENKKQLVKVRNEWEKRLWGHKMVKRTKNIMTKESKESQQTTKVSFLNQVMRAGFCKQRIEERGFRKYSIGV